MITQAASIMLVACASAQSPFSLDTSFRTSIEHQYVNSIWPLDDGRVIASGVMRFPGEMSDKRLVRLLPDGTRDETFYNSGLGQGKIVPWQDRFYVAGALSVRRILPSSGQNDISFAMGSMGIPYFSPLQSGDYHVFPDGRVLLGGSHTVNYPAGGYSGQHQLIWFTNTGYLDTTRVHRKGNGAVMRFGELPDGKFICSGFASYFDGHPVDRIFRVHPDGAVDTTFNSNVNWGVAQSFLPLTDGRVYAAGRYTMSSTPTDTLRLARFHTNGSMDLAFAPPNFTLGDLPNNGGLGAQVLNVRSWGASHIMATGHFQFVNGEPRRGICVFDSTGGLSSAFDDCGIGPFTFMGLTNGSISGLIPDSDSTHYYIWGRYNGYSDGTTNDPLQRFVTRLHVGDFTTGSSMSAPKQVFMLYPNPSSGSATLHLEQVPPQAQLVLRDALGREVLRQRVSGHYTTLTVARSGVYAVELWSQGERMSAQRLVVE